MTEEMEPMTNGVLQRLSHTTTTNPTHIQEDPEAGTNTTKPSATIIGPFPVLIVDMSLSTFRNGSSIPHSFVKDLYSIL